MSLLKFDLVQDIRYEMEEVTYKLQLILQTMSLKFMVGWPSAESLF